MNANFESFLPISGPQLVSKLMGTRTEGTVELTLNGESRRVPCVLWDQERFGYSLAFRGLIAEHNGRTTNDAELTFWENGHVGSHCFKNVRFG